MNNDTSEIAKLTERISKDPKSKLFVPLAEEYKKTGDIEMAVHILTEGLKNNPGYVTARSFLGKLLIDQGELTAAQKEFEEVIKAIPDNLMAQRKLGDIYALQGNPAEALKHYRSVLAINPKDNETAVLVTEAEAGRDIKKLVPGPKLSAPAKPDLAAKVDKKELAGKQEPAIKPAGGQGKPASLLPTVPTPVPRPTAENVFEEAEEVLVVEPLEPADASGEATGTLKAGAGDFDFLAENDAALQSSDATAHEETFASDEARGGVSPFPAEQSFASGSDLAAATEQAEPFGLAEGTAPSADGSGESPDLIEPFALAEETAPLIDEIGTAPDLGEPFPAADVRPHEEFPALDDADSFASTDEPVPSFEDSVPSVELGEPFAGSEQSEEAPLDAFAVNEPIDDLGQGAEVPGETDLVVGELLAEETGLAGHAHTEETSEAITAEIIDEPGKQGDDFTTDTLAELYISQGFFEKAIDIYERMLADHPTSEGLKGKLVHVRALAAAAPGGDVATSPAAESAIEAESGDRSRVGSGADVFAAQQPGFTQPRLDDWELPAAKRASGSSHDVVPRPVTQPKPFDLGFEPREYVPPDALPRRRESSEIKEQEALKGPGPVHSAAGVTAAQQAAPVNRKETVERLESWLKNIMKES